MLASPHSQHFEQIIKASKAKKHIFVEKPFTLTLSDAIKSIKISKKFNIKIGAGFNRRFLPSFNYLKKITSKEMKTASEKDWKTEYLSPKISVKSVSGVSEAINHINKYGSSHTDSIVTKNNTTARKFLSNIKSSIAVHNASTQFADGGEFGFGAEIGISTDKLHPRGPIGVDQLTTYKYILEGKGQVRK